MLTYLVPELFLDVSTTKLISLELDQLLTEIHNAIQASSTTPEQLYDLFTLLNLRYAKTNDENQQKSDLLTQLENKLHDIVGGSYSSNMLLLSTRILYTISDKNPKSGFITRNRFALEKKLANFNYFYLYSFSDINLFEDCSYADLEFLTAYLKSAPKFRVARLFAEKDADDEKANRILENIYGQSVDPFCDHTKLLDLLRLMLASPTNWPQTAINQFNFLEQLETAYRAFHPNITTTTLTKTKTRIAETIFISCYSGWELVNQQKNLQEFYKKMPITADFFQALYVNNKLQYTSKFYFIIDSLPFSALLAIPNIVKIITDMSNSENYQNEVAEEYKHFGWRLIFCCILDNISTPNARDCLINLLMKLRNIDKDLTLPTDPSNPIKLIAALKALTSERKTDGHKAVPVLSTYLIKLNPRRHGIDFNAIIDFIGTGKERNTSFLHLPYKTSMIPAGTLMPSRVEMLFRIISFLSNNKSRPDQKNTLHEFKQLINEEIKTHDQKDHSWISLFDKLDQITSIDHVYRNAAPLLAAHSFAQAARSTPNNTPLAFNTSFSIYPDEDIYLKEIIKYWYQLEYSPAKSKMITVQPHQELTDEGQASPAPTIAHANPAIQYPPQFLIPGPPENCLLLLDAIFPNQNHKANFARLYVDQFYYAKDNCLPKNPINELSEEQCQATYGINIKDRVLIYIFRAFAELIFNAEDIASLDNLVKFEELLKNITPNKIDFTAIKINYFALLFSYKTPKTTPTDDHELINITQQIDDFLIQLHQRNTFDELHTFSPYDFFYDKSTGQLNATGFYKWGTKLPRLILIARTIATKDIVRQMEDILSHSAQVTEECIYNFFIILSLCYPKNSEETDRRATLLANLERRIMTSSLGISDAQNLPLHALTAHALLASPENQTEFVKKHREYLQSTLLLFQDFSLHSFNEINIFTDCSYDELVHLANTNSWETPEAATTLEKINSRFPKNPVQNSQLKSLIKQLLACIPVRNNGIHYFAALMKLEEAYRSYYPANTFSLTPVKKRVAENYLIYSPGLKTGVIFDPSEANKDNAKKHVQLREFCSAQPLSSDLLGILFSTSGKYSRKIRMLNEFFLAHRNYQEMPDLVEKINVILESHTSIPRSWLDSFWLILSKQKSPLALDLLKKVLNKLSIDVYAGITLPINPIKLMHVLEKFYSANAEGLDSDHLLRYIVHCNPRRKEIDFDAIIDFIGTGHERNIGRIHSPYKREMIPANTKMPVRVDSLKNLIAFLLENKDKDLATNDILLNEFKNNIETTRLTFEKTDPEWAKLFALKKPENISMATIYANATPLLAALEIAKNSFAIEEFNESLSKTEFSQFEDESSYIIAIAKYWHKQEHPGLYPATSTPFWAVNRSNNKLREVEMTEIEPGSKHRSNSFDSLF